MKSRGVNIKNNEAIDKETKEERLGKSIMA